MRKYFKLSTPEIVLVVLSLMLFSCEKKQQVSGKELVIGVSQDYRATDVYSHKGFNCLIFETLVKMDKRRKVIPLLAKSWEISEDGKHYTFHLRKDVTFSDGTSLTAQQVKESMSYKNTRRSKREPKGRPENTKSGGGNAGDIKREYSTFDNERYNVPGWYSFKSINVIDDHTLRFNLPLPYTLFLSELATTHMYPVLKVDDSEEVTGYIGTGPYKIDEHKRTRYMILVKNENYWQGDVGIDRVRLKVIHDAETRAIALEAGEIDITGYDHFDKIPNESVARVKDL